LVRLSAFKDPFAVVTALCVAAGLWMRARGALYDVSPLWLDEAAWALTLFKEPIAEQYIRPPGFVAITRGICSVFGMYELSLRLLPWLAGIAAVALSIPLSRRLFRHEGARLLFVAVIALHPAAIDLSKEFKPYSLSLGLHVACALFAVGYQQTERLRWMVAALVCASAGVLFAQDMVFLCPGIYLLLGYKAWKDRRKRQLIAIAASGLATLGLMTALYFLMWRHIGAGSGGDETAYWSRKYDVFFVEGKSDGNQLGWMLAKYFEIAAFPGYRDQLWEPFGALDRERMARLLTVNAWFWSLLNLGGIVTLARRRDWGFGLVFGLPLLVLVSFNLLGFWPFGVFRTNLFVLVYAGALAAWAVDHPLPRLAAFTPTGLLLLLPLAVFERGFHRGKQLTWLTDNSAIPEAMRALVDLQGKVPDGRELLFLDSESCDPWVYYAEVHPKHRKFGRGMAERFKTKCYAKPVRGGIFGYSKRHLRSDSERFWFLIKRPRVLREWPRELPPTVRMIGERKVGFDESTRVLGLRYFPEEDESGAEAVPERHTKKRRRRRGRRD
jgi:hypothetical protein